jgi:hypothetical protein
MKKLLILTSSFMLFPIGISFLFLFQSCNEPHVYLPGREWDFIVKRTNSSVVDTLILRTFDETWEITQKKIEWKYIIKDPNTFTQITEETGVIDRRGSFFTKIFLKNEIWIHPPRSSYLRLSEMVPFPQINFPIYKGQIINWEITPKKVKAKNYDSSGKYIGDSVPEEWKKLIGKTATGKIGVKGKIYYNNPIIKDSCWVLNAFGNSPIGTIKSKYYFSEKYGFVFFFYDFNDYKVEIILSGIKL